MSKPKPTQAEPTQPQPRDEAGRALDRHGLPLSGPARLRALNGRTDPAAPQAEQPADAQGAAGGQE
jgi:hypothetical protein